MKMAGGCSMSRGIDRMSRGGTQGHGCQAENPGNTLRQESDLLLHGSKCRAAVPVAGQAGVRFDYDKETRTFHVVVRKAEK